MKTFKQAIRDAALAVQEHGWLHQGTDCDAEDYANCFIEIITKHLAPFAPVEAESCSPCLDGECAMHPMSKQPESCGGSPGKPNWRRRFDDKVENDFHPLTWHTPFFRMYGDSGCESRTHNNPTYCQPCPGCGDCSAEIQDHMAVEKETSAAFDESFRNASIPSPEAIQVAEEIWRTWWECEELPNEQDKAMIQSVALIIQRLLAEKDARWTELALAVEKMLQPQEATMRIDAERALRILIAPRRGALSQGNQ